MVGFGNFARKASLCVGFHPGTLHGYFFYWDFWPNLNFPLEHQTKIVLTLSALSIFVTEGLFIYIYFLLFEENHENRISRPGEKISLTISLFFRKMIA